MAPTEPPLKVLLVDDDREVLKVAAANLEAEGYLVLSASNSHEALRLLENNRDTVLLITDIVMPGWMDGFDLADTAQLRRPGLQVIYTSGYLRDEGVWEGMLLRKPWTIEDLKRAIAAIVGPREGRVAVAAADADAANPAMPRADRAEFPTKAAD